jgi:hypothetical protein
MEHILAVFLFNAVSGILLVMFINKFNNYVGKEIYPN